MDTLENRPTLKGEIKKARASNYSLSRAINEFIDNSLDTNATQILVEFRENSGGLCSISISDDSKNGINANNIKKIFSWTYERERIAKDIGEFGTGFKSASVNLGEKLILITCDKIENKCYECIADWATMAEHDNWVPSLKEVSLQYYKKKGNHPYKSGTTFIIDDIITTRNNKFELSYVIEIAANYKYILQYYPELTIQIKYLDNIYDLRKFTYYYFDDNTTIEDEIGVYTLKKDYILDKSLDYIIGVFTDKDKKYWAKSKGQFKNGNFKLEETMFESKYYEKKCSIIFKTCLDKKLKNKQANSDDSDIEEYNPAILPCGTVDIIRTNRVVGKSIRSFIAPRNDGYANYIKHEIWYEDKFLDINLGISFNKSNDGHIPDTNLKYAFHYIIKKHQNKLINNEKATDELLLKNTKKTITEIVAYEDSKDDIGQDEHLLELKIDNSADSNSDNDSDILIFDDKPNDIIEINSDELYDNIVHNIITEIKRTYIEQQIKDIEQKQFIKNILIRLTKYKCD